MLHPFSYWSDIAMASLEKIKELVQFNTVSRDSNLPLIDYIANYLDDLGIRSHRVESPDGKKSNLYASVGPNEPGGVVLSGHTDVVPTDGQDWNTDPFAPEVKENRLYGRGTCDMKGFIGTALALVPEMSSLVKPIHFAWSYDEEVGCKGAPSMIAELSKHLPEPEAVIVGEPTLMRAITGHKGMVTLTTSILGFEAHSSQTHRGVSAVMTAAKLVEKLNSMATELAEQTNIDTGFEPHHSTIHVGVIRGGTAINIISRHCEFQWDIRCIPNDDPKTIIDEFEKYCRDEVLPSMRSISSDCAIGTEVTASAPAFLMSESPAMGLLASLGTQPTEQHAPYVAEAGQFQAAGFPTVVCGPGSIDQAHKPNEFIALDQVNQGEHLLRKLISRLSNP
jgi:acetylornithine deacetylase